MARKIPIAQDVTAEADSGGHTDHRPAIALLPSLIALRARGIVSSGAAGALVLSLSRLSLAHARKLASHLARHRVIYTDWRYAGCGSSRRPSRVGSARRRADAAPGRRSRLIPADLGQATELIRQLLDEAAREPGAPAVRRCWRTDGA